MRTLALGLLVLVAGTAQADEQKPTSKGRYPAPPPIAAPALDMKEWQLANGLDVVYLGVHRWPVVAVQVWYHVGSKDDPEGGRGTAHLFEHLMFSGTTHVRPGEHARMIEGLGGYANASTRDDTTYFEETIPREYTDFAVRLEAERMRNLLLRPEAVDHERLVVKEEELGKSEAQVRMRPVRALAYARHPYAHTSGDDAGDLDRVPVLDLRRFYDTYYRPNNATLVIVGDVSEAEARASAERWLAGIPRGPEPPHPARGAAEPRQDQPRRQAEKGVELIIGGYRLPDARSADRFAIEVASHVLHERLRPLREKGKLMATTGYELLEESGLFYVVAGVQPQGEAPKVEAALLEEVTRLAEQPVVDKELRRAKNRAIARDIPSEETVQGLAVRIGESRMLRGDARAWLDDRARYEAVTADDVRRVARTYLVSANLSLIVPTEGP